MYNKYAFKYVYHRLSLKNSYKGSFENNIYAIFVGDDHVFSVHPRIASWFNEMTIVPIMAELGLKYTTETKGVATQELRWLEEVEFLKRTFRYDSYVGRYVAPLRINVVMEIANWTRLSTQSDEITISNARDALRELSLHTEEIFNVNAKILCDAVNEVYPMADFPIFEVLDYRDIQENVLKSELYMI
jgi:hypothetical protein